MRKRRQYHELVIPSYGSRRKGWYINLLNMGIKRLSFIWKVVVIMCIVSVKGKNISCTIKLKRAILCTNYEYGLVVLKGTIRGLWICPYNWYLGVKGA